jgi:Mn-dependent DtxR family transcriptional regulator
MTSMYSRAARELVRAVRGKRSQVALSRRLGYLGNPLTDWEAGRSQPDAMELLQAARLARLPVSAAFERLQGGVLPRAKDGSIDLPTWLDSFRGTSSMAALAQRMGRSRHCVRRWLSGESRIKLADFLELLDTVTGRAQDWVAELVPIERVPALLERHTRASRAHTLSLELPWTEAILRVLETDTYRRDPRASEELIAAWLGIPLASVAVALSRLEEAGVLAREQGRYVALRELSIDTRAAPEARRQLRRHWLSALLDRAHSAHPSDWAAYNVMSLRADLEQVRERLSATYRELRGVVSASTPTEEVALVLMQLVHWPAPA